MANKVRREEGISVETLNKSREREREREREEGIQEVLRKEEKEEIQALTDKSSPYISDQVALMTMRC